MRTPILTVEPGWRDNVLATWSYLKQHYHVSSNHECATHIHISLTPKYDLEQVKRIAFAVIHFKTAIEVLVPEERRGNAWAQSSWLDGPALAQKNRSRSQSIEEIERASDIPTILRLMQATNDPNYAWNFLPLLTTKQTIEFRKLPPSETADEALSWAELALNFIQASLRYGSPRSLQTFPANIKGLRWFLEKVYDPKINAPDRLQRIWADKPATAALEPIYQPPIVNNTKGEIKTKTKADMKRLQSHPNSK